jgi:hypothetical protein
MLQLASKMLGLPFDYAAFDHQPTTEELVSIVRVLLQAARKNVPLHEISKFETIASNIVAGFYNSTLEYKMDHKVFRVTGGLMSGLRWTSVVGNAWNTVMTNLVLKLLSDIGVSSNDIDRYIRGDDSAIYVPNWGTGALVKSCYDIVGIDAGEGKFSLQANAMEFLRVWYEGRCSGYPSRAVPGLTQRKPWSSSPWTPDYVVRALYDTIRILRRRVPERRPQIDRLWVHLRTIWLRDHNLPSESLSVPIFLGGFGIEPQSDNPGRIVPSLLGTRIQKNVNVTNQNDWRANKLTNYYLERYKIQILPERARDIAKEELTSTITADDVIEISRELRQEWLKQVRSTKYRFTPVHTAPVPTSPVNIDWCPLDQPQLLLDTLSAQAPLFGHRPEILTATADYHQLRPTCTLKEWLRLHYPACYIDLQKFHHTWYIGERIDYLAGKLPISAAVLHPALTKIWQLVVAASVPPRRAIPRLSITLQASKIEMGIYLSSLSQTLYCW